MLWSRVGVVERTDTRMYVPVLEQVMHVDTCTCNKPRSIWLACCESEQDSRICRVRIGFPSSPCLSKPRSRHRPRRGAGPRAPLAPPAAGSTKRLYANRLGNVTSSRFLCRSELAIYCAAGCRSVAVDNHEGRCRNIHTTECLI